MGEKTAKIVQRRLRKCMIQSMAFSVCVQYASVEDIKLKLGEREREREREREVEMRTGGDGCSLVSTRLVVQLLASVHLKSQRPQRLLCEETNYQLAQQLNSHEMQADF